MTNYRVAPPPHTVAEQSLPLNFFDILWLSFHPMHLLLFYHIPNCTKPYFLETLIPKLKQSLSITLKHFFPFAANIIHPLKPDKEPVIRYRAGDSVSFTVFESNGDFDDLVGNHARDADRFYDFIPPLEQRIDEESEEKVLETLSIQVTLFPGSGVCVGVSNHHAVCDAASVFEFIKSWAFINIHGGEDVEFLKKTKSLPIFDRSLIKYPPELDSVFLNQVNQNNTAAASSSSFPFPTNRVRATFVLTPTDMKKLKDMVETRNPGLGHVSSFVVMAAYVWSCLAKSMTDGDGDDDEPEFFSFAVDARARINPPVQENYFGNCISFCFPPGVPHRELVGEEGFFTAAATIAEEIQNRVLKNENILAGAENWISTEQKRVFTVSGSAKLDLYTADFGWGVATKLEGTSIDEDKYAMMLCKSREFHGGVEISLSLPKLIMDDFTASFYHGIKN